AGRLLVFFTGISRSANTILEAQRTETEADKREVLESLHATKEIGLRVKQALEGGRLDEFGDLMHEHWESKKRRSDAISDQRADVRDSGGRLFLVGSGGGAGHASHAACDFRKLAGLEAYCPTDNVSELTARINDEGWADSYAGWLRSSRLNGTDVLLVFSVGG